MKRPKREDYQKPFHQFNTEGYISALEAYIDHLEKEREEREEEIKAYQIAIKGLRAVHEITKPHQP